MLNSSLSLPVSEEHIQLPGPSWTLDWPPGFHLSPAQTLRLRFLTECGTQRVGHCGRSPDLWWTTAGCWCQLACFPGGGDTPLELPVDTLCFILYVSARCCIQEELNCHNNNNNNNKTFHNNSYWSIISSTNIFIAIIIVVAMHLFCFSYSLPPSFSSPFYTEIAHYRRSEDPSLCRLSFVTLNKTMPHQCVSLHSKRSAMKRGVKC